ncbi:MAG: helix-turn-helix domain-containing protein [Massiliimalia sp.]
MKGRGIQRQNWQVDEPVAAGYSRVYLIESGTVFYCEGNIPYTLRPGTLYIFPATVPYQMTRDPIHPFHCLWFHMDFFPIRVSSLIQIPVESDSILKLQLELLQELFSKDFQEESFGENVIHSFAQYLLKFYLPQQQTPMTPVIRFIREHYRDPNLTVNGISTHFGYTPEHFIRTFTKALGVTPYQYLLSMRMYEARRLLLENYSVSKTAQEVGYEDTRSFSHAFQKKYAISPSQLKKGTNIFP